MTFPPYRGDMLLEEEPCLRYEEDTIRSFGPGRCALCWRPGNRLPRWPGISGVHAGTLGNWLKKERLDRHDNGQLDEDSMAELVRLRKEVAELRMERDVLKRSVVLWVKEATR